MSQEHLSKLLKSWTYILENSPDTGVYFYNTLFCDAPVFRVLFVSNNLNLMAEKFMATMGVLLAKAHKGNSLMADVQHLASRHVGYGVAPEHYPIVGKALLKALEYGLKDKWNEDLKNLWSNLYDNLSEAMIKMSNQTIKNQVA